ncbi:SDR family oxidoreductase [Streptomyces sp. LN499]|uniref:SDR family oxidoreductase n=1 Tax=Streptomyces sp. LN499 TaxID=3112977 RepID=UPI0037107904
MFDAVIFGGGGLICVTLGFARAGTRLALADMSADGLQETARLIDAAGGGEALTLTCDVTSEEDIQAAVNRTVERFGSLDAAFNNAGVEQPVQPAADTAKDDWDRILGVSLTGAFLCTRAQIRQMLQQDGGGAIVNISSGAGVIGLTKSAALEYGPRGVRINAVCPGTISTPMVDTMVEGGELDRAQAETGQAIHRLGTADEIAQAVLWLSSPGASYVTGIALPVDGGYTAQ